MHERKPVSPETLEGVASELAGLPISSRLAGKHADVFEPLMEAIETLRTLPIKEVAPPLIFVPEEAQDDRR